MWRYKNVAFYYYSGVSVTVYNARAVALFVGCYSPLFVGNMCACLGHWVY